MTGRSNVLGLVTRRYSCPDWCERDDHGADAVDDDNPPVHYGPEWGLLSAQAAGDDEPAVLLAEAAFVGRLSAAGLRKLAADALAAAEWLETRDLRVVR